jgi:biopolymer transport protein ExbD
MKRFIDDDDKLVAGINVTPIIDVALVLVIILLITAPMITVLNMEIDLPQAKARSIEDEARLSVTLGKDGALAVDEDSVASHNLQYVLSQRIAESSNENILVVVRADSRISYDKIREVIKSAKQAGARRIAIATQQRGKERM